MSANSFFKTAARNTAISSKDSYSSIQHNEEGGDKNGGRSSDDTSDLVSNND